MSYRRYYGFRDRWFSVYATFDPTDVSLVSNPDDDFPFVFNCDIVTPHVIGHNWAYTVDLCLDVLVLADGVTYKVVDVDEFEEAYDAGMFGKTWYVNAKRELERLVQEIEDGRFLDNLQQISPFPTSVQSNEIGSRQVFEPDEIEFKYHPDFPRFEDPQP